MLGPIRLLLRRGVAAVQRWIYPARAGGPGVCGRCHRPWAFCERHFTKADRFCCSPLCEPCWRELSVAGRMAYYEVELAEWIADMRKRPHITIAPDLEREVLRAVAEGR